MNTEDSEAQNCCAIAQSKCYKYFLLTNDVVLHIYRNTHMSTLFLVPLRFEISALDCIIIFAMIFRIDSPYVSPIFCSVRTPIFCSLTESQHIQSDYIIYLSLYYHLYLLKEKMSAPFFIKRYEIICLNFFCCSVRTPFVVSVPPPSVSKLKSRIFNLIF
jgi:hypothetical protein